MGKGIEYEEEEQNEPFEGDPKKKECAKLPEKVKRGEEISLLIR
jgi:hypothetical protein